MFSTATKEKKTNSAGAATANEKESGQTTVIARGTVLEGVFTSAENVRLDGAVKGDVRVDKRLVMGVESMVNGNIEARDAVIKGKVTGDVRVQESLHLMDSAIIEGQITARTMMVDEGARYNGSCKIGV